MRYSQEILDDILLDAKHGFSLLDIAIRLNLPFDELFADYCNPEHQVKQFYDAGISQGRVETDKVLYTLAKNGSTSAKNEYDKKQLIAQFLLVCKTINES